MQLKEDGRKNCPLFIKSFWANHLQMMIQLVTKRKMKKVYMKHSCSSTTVVRQEGARNLFSKYACSKNLVLCWVYIFQTLQSYVSWMYVSYIITVFEIRDCKLLMGKKLKRTCCGRLIKSFTNHLTSCRSEIQFRFWFLNH